MRFSYVMLPDYPLADSMESIKKADELGFYGCYAADETWHKDMWLLFAAAADKTPNIRFGPSLSGVVLREPTLIAQAVATLDELTGGRAECVISCGNFGLLAQYHIDWAQTRPLSRTHRGAQGDAHPPRRGRDQLRGRVLQVHRAVHVRPSGAGAAAAPARRDARAEVVPQSRARSPTASTTRLSYTRGGVRLPGGQRQDRRREGREGLAVARHRRVDRLRDRSRLGRGQGGRAQHGRPLRVVHAGGAARAQRGRPAGPAAGHRRARQGRPGRARSS